MLIIPSDVLMTTLPAAECHHTHCAS